LLGEKEDGQHKILMLANRAVFENFGKPPIAAEGTGMGWQENQKTPSKTSGRGGEVR
jgi:hypothetical protein